MFKRFLSLVLAAVILGMVSYRMTSAVSACTPSGPDSWFIANMFFEPSSLPAGIIVDRNGTAEWSIRNQSSAPLYLIENFNNGATFENTELPETVRPTFKLVDNLAYQYDYSTRHYTLYDGPVSSGPTIQTPLPAENNRPANISVPVDEQFSFSAYYGSEPIIINGTIRFALNPNYDPERGYKGCSDTTSVWAYVFFGLVVIFIFVLLIRWAFHKKPAGPVKNQ